MSAAKIETPTLLDANRSHWVELDSRGNITREKVFPHYATAWRGEPVIVTMSCDRYRTAGMSSSDTGDLTAWRVYASEARQHTDEAGRYGAHVTDTARSRLSDACQPEARAWLDSEDYRESYRRALVFALAREVEKRHYLDTAARLIERYAPEIGTDATLRLRAAIDAHRAYIVALEGVTA